MAFIDFIILFTHGYEIIVAKAVNVKLAMVKSAVFDRVLNDTFCHNDVNIIVIYENTKVNILVMQSSGWILTNICTSNSIGSPLATSLAKHNTTT